MANRPLRGDEIAVLEKQGCRAEDWSRVEAADGFYPVGVVRNVEFRGGVALGRFAGRVVDLNGKSRRAGVYDASLEDASVGDNCLVRLSDVADADIGPGSVVDRVGLLCHSGETAFANGELANILAEHGGRAIPLWRLLSSQYAHLLCHLRGQPAAAVLLDLIRRDVDALRSARSRVGAHCRIERCGQLRNVYLEDGATVDGAARLDDCYVAASREAPARIGPGVVAERCVFQRASATSGGVTLVNCLVGEGVKLERGFSAEHSLFFANSAFAQGEACSVMAGPFSISHHKATLALAVQCSFANFGSSANASNHHFKLGPLHGGFLGRGARLGSGSYLFLPADIGAFSTVTGRNSKNLDTRDFPFSLILGEGDRSILVPAVGVFGTGAFRDSRKWLERDARRGVADPLDNYRSEIFSPYVFQAADRGAELLEKALHGGGDLQAGGATIPESRVEPGLRLYRAGLTYLIGLRLMDAIARGPKGAKPDLDAAVAALSIPEGEDGGDAGDWRDWGGLLLSGGRAKRFIRDLASGTYDRPEAIQSFFRETRDAYPDMEWRWLAWRWRKERGVPDADKAREFLGAWREAVRYRRACLLRDAVKEFSMEKRISFGIEQDCEFDFRQARGDFESHPLVDAIEAETKRLVDFADAMIGKGEG